MRLITLRKNGLLVLAVAGVLTLGLLLNASMKSAFEFDPDEGTNLVKTKLYLEGYSLYQQIWSDQPPFFTVLLALWFKIFGPSAYSGRILVLIFSIILVWGLFQTIRKRSNNFIALIACALLILSPDFIRLSGSIMVGLPSLAFAVLSLYCAVRYSDSGQKVLLLLSAAFMALSLSTKLSGFLLIPSVLLELSGRACEKQKAFPGFKLPFVPLLLWLISGLFIYLFLTAAFFYPDSSLFSEQLLNPHLAKQNLAYPDFTLIFKMLAQDYDIFLLAVIAVATNLRPKNRPAIILPAAWMGIAALALIVHRPFWYHHYPLVFLPACWLAAIASGQLLMKTKIKKTKTVLYYVISGLIILAAVRIPLKFIDVCLSLKQRPAGQEKIILDLISKFKKDSRWIFTDLPIFAFNSNMLVPAEAAVLTDKRIPTAELTAAVLKKYNPGLILLGRFNSYDPRMISVIQKDYRKETETSISWRLPSNTAYCWQPIAVLLPSRMQAPVDKRLSCFYSQKITLYVRKNNQNLNGPR